MDETSYPPRRGRQCWKTGPAGALPPLLRRRDLRVAVDREGRRVDRGCTGGIAPPHRRRCGGGRQACLVDRRRRASVSSSRTVRPAPRWLLNRCGPLRFLIYVSGRLSRSPNGETPPANRAASSDVGAVSLCATAALGLN